MRKLTHKTHKIVPCKWNNWHNVSIKEYLTTALTPDLSVIFALLIVAKSIFYYCVPTCYLSPCSVCWQWDTSAQCSYLCREARCQQIAICFTLHPSRQLRAQWLACSSLFLPRPHTEHLRYLYHHDTATSPCGFFLILCKNHVKSLNSVFITNPLTE